ncbi:MAG TPA: DUF3168 domain-containing protein [Devosia sp.]|nr:DUF3168 domain-containing protein [Devosia sp.]
MSALKIVAALLKADPEIQSLTGGRVFLLRRPQTSQLPAITVTNIYEGEDQHLAGATAYFEATIAVACFAGSAVATDDLGEAVKACLSDITETAVESGESPPAPFGTATIWKSGGDVMDWSEDNSVVRRIIDFTVRWRR